MLTGRTAHSTQQKPPRRPELPVPAGAAFCIYETEENAQRSAPLERMTF